MTRPYEGFYAVCRSILQRDNFTCQVCGIEGIEKAPEWLKRRIDFLSSITIHPEKHQDQVVSRAAHELEELRFDARASGLIVHHKNGDKTDQRPENLVTVCYSCQRRLHPRGRVLTIEEAKKRLEKQRNRALRKNSASNNRAHANSYEYRCLCKKEKGDISEDDNDFLYSSRLQGR